MKLEELNNRKILSASFDDGLRLELEGLGKVFIFDGGQSCCENRYATCDDDVESLVGNTLLRVEVKPGPGEDSGEYETHETDFVEVQTDKGFITMTTHNIHNGCYGGFYIKVEKR